MTTPFRPVIRPLAADELDQLVELCAEHAAYERADYAPDGKKEALARYLLGPTPRASCLVAAAANGLAGYATWSPEFSTWGAGEYLHMDCLYLRPAWRGQGLGADFLRRLAEICIAAGLAHMEWQSPIWNEDALRFYRRAGATTKEKARLQLDPRRVLIDPSAAAP